MSDDWETSGSARRGGRFVKPAAVLLGAALVAVVVVLGRGEVQGALVIEASESPVPQSTDAPTIPVAPGDWQPMAGGPLSPRQDAASAWTGTELLVWGGRVRDRLSTVDDGAAYEPIGDRWRPLPRSPLSPRGGPAAVWTGTELFVWGGAGDQQGVGRGIPVEGVPLDDGAAYDPATNRWRTIASSPLSPRRDAKAVLLDDRVLVWGGTTYLGGPHSTDGALYDPDTDSWALLPASPLEGRHDTDLEVTAVKDTAFIVSSTFRGIATALYDPASNEWDPEFGSPPLRGDLPTAVVALEDAVLVWGQGPQPTTSAMAFRYTPADREWLTVDRPPRPPNRREELAAAGYRAVSWDRGDGLVFDASTNRWAAMPDAPSLAGGSAVHVWTGDRLLVWHSGGRPEDARRGAAWVPAETW